MLKLPLRIATRKSKLALWQTDCIVQQLRVQHPELTVELVEVTTTGDKITDRPLAEVGGKALFIKELENALLEGRADIAVHSLKDMPADLSGQFVIAAVSARENPFDAFLSRRYACWQELPPGAIVGTSSPRRSAQLKALRPDLRVVSLRGNVDTRLNKLIHEEYDAIVLACAGLQRLNLQSHITAVFSAEEMLPAAGQGVIAIECLKHSHWYSVMRTINHLPTEQCVLAERTMNQALQGDCYSPIGSFAEIRNRELHLHGKVLNSEGTEALTVLQTGEPIDAISIGRQAAESLLQQGAKRLLSC